MPSESGAAWTPQASSERRLSNSSDGSAGSGYSKALTSDSADFLATRPHTASVIPGRPAANPLQFIKVGPADLGSRAREQLRKAELAKKTEPSRIEKQEDWQSNLDSWKSSRRKRVEHIIERCVEVKRLETETPHPRGKGKTFNEMMEERAGRRRRNHLALYTDDDGHDLSDLGIGTSSTKSSLSEDCDTHSLASDGVDLDKNHSDVDNCDLANRKLGSSANEYDTCTTTTISSPEPEEYTYEGAIEGYKSRISQTNSNILKSVVNKETSPDKTLDLKKIRTTVSNKIEEKVTSLKQSTDIKNTNQKKDLPKVDIHKRREQFERENSQETQNKPKLPDIENKRSIKDRLSSLEKFTEEAQKSTPDLSKLPTEVKPLKERLSSLEKVKALNENDKIRRQSNGDLSNTISVKERLSTFKSQTSEEDVKIVKTEVNEVSFCLKERLSCLDAAKNKNLPIYEEEISNNYKTEAKDCEKKEQTTESSLKSDLAGIENQMQSFYRSLDSLDINGQSSPNSFERVQSFEDLNNTVPSDIETEDSGIHTARDSCAPADDIADLTQVASPVGEPMTEASEYESSNEDVPVTNYKNEAKSPEPTPSVIEDVIIEEIEDPEHTKTDDSESNYLQAVSQPEELSVTSEITEIQLDKDDEDTLKSLENQDTSVSLNEPVSTSSDGDTVVFEGKMTIHLNLNEICNKGAGEGSKSTDINRTSMPMVLDALEIAFQELDSEVSTANTTVEESNDTSIVDVEKTKSEKKMADKTDSAPVYENIEVFYQNGGEISFPLDLPPKTLEPPKEKPPPPPVDEQNDELLGNGNFKHTSSARRIKKEIRNKRTSFLGIEGQDDSYLDADLALAPSRPDITSFLQQESKIEKMLYKRTLSHDMDAKLRESRDSGVDEDRSADWCKGSSPENSSPHSRQNSEPYNNMTLTSDEEEAAKKSEAGFTNDLSTKLSGLSNPAETDKIDSLDKKLQEQQDTNEDWPDGLYDDSHSKEVLRFERELLQLEQEELRRQRNHLIRDQNRIIQKSNQDISKITDKPITRAPQPTNHRHSMPNLLANENYAIQMERKTEDKRKPIVSEEHMQRHFGVEESRRVLYDSRRVEVSQPTLVQRPPPQPILPPRPRRESIEREMTRNSRVPSANDYVNVDRTPVQMRQKINAPVQQNGQYHPMSRHTLQALSAAPSSKLISNNDWLQSKPHLRPNNYNYSNHWLMQEAEQRLTEGQRQKIAQHRHSYHEAAHNMNKMKQLSNSQQQLPPYPAPPLDEKVLSVSGKRKCSHCGEELGRGAAMIIKSLSLCYHVSCFTCALCGAALGDGRAGADVRVRGATLHCHHCYSTSDTSCSQV